MTSMMFELDELIDMDSEFPCTYLKRPDGTGSECLEEVKYILIQNCCGWTYHICENHKENFCTVREVDPFWYCRACKGQQDFKKFILRQI